jgi:hypothetical protein
MNNWRKPCGKSTDNGTWRQYFDDCGGIDGFGCTVAVKRPRQVAISRNKVSNFLILENRTAGQLVEVRNKPPFAAARNRPLSVKHFVNVGY